MQDPVHTIVLKDYVQSQVNAMAMQLGESNYKEIINNVDVETRDNLMEYVSLWTGWWTNFTALWLDIC